MPSRTQLFQQLPWNGGINTQYDPSSIPANQLTTADNVVFSVRGSRQKREGVNYWDAVGVAITRSSAGTTRTIILNATYAGMFAVSDDISIFHSSFEDDYDGKTFTILSVTTTNVVDDTITYTHPNSLTEASIASNAKIGINEANKSIYALIDFWRDVGGNAKTRDAISLFGDGRVYRYDDSGIRTEIVDTGTVLSPYNKASSTIMNNILIFGTDFASNVPKKVYIVGALYTYEDLAGTPPLFNLCRQHLGRLWTNEKGSPDRLHYCTTGNPEEWNGAGDSGALDIGVGDGDPIGITGIFPTFKGELFVAKKTKLYRISGFTPESFKVELVSDGIGVESHNSIVALDQDDLVFTSVRGFHSMQASASFGDFSATFISKEIQPTFQDFDLVERMWGVYVPELNSIAFGVNVGGLNNNNDLFFFNIELKQWYKWTDIPCESLYTRTEGNRKKLYMGTNNGRILTTQNRRYSDYGNVGIPYRVKSGLIFPDNQLYTVKGFKKLTLHFKPTGSFNFTCKVKIDNYEEQTLIFSQAGQSDILGDTFILGTSLLGIDPVLAPNTFSIDGYGHGCTIEIEQSSADEPIEIYGFALEWEGAETAQENILGAE